MSEKSHIQLTEKYRICWNRKGGYILEEYRKIRKDPEEWAWVADSWPSTIQSVVNRFSHLELCDAKFSKVPELLEVIDRCAQVLSSALEPSIRINLKSVDHESD